MDKAIELALETWYPEDHPLHFDPLHPAIKLAGEAGELLDLYGKDQFKPNFSWWYCERCGFMPCDKVDDPTSRCAYSCWRGEEHTSLVLDELGDWWYYWRILAYQFHLEIEPDEDIDAPDDMLMFLTCLNYNSAKILIAYEVNEIIPVKYLQVSFGWFMDILFLLECTLNQLTDLNYRKLNSDPTNHGWKGA